MAFFPTVFEKLPKHSSSNEKIHSHSLGILFPHPISNSTYTNLAGERSDDWWSQVIISKILFLFFDSRWIWHHLNYFFGLFFSLKGEFFSVMDKLDAVARLCIIKWYYFFFHNSLYLNLIFSLKTTHTITDPLLCLPVRTTHSSFSLSLGFLFIYTLFLLLKISNLDSSIHNTFCHFFNVQFLCFFTHVSIFFLFTFCKWGFLIAMHPYWFFTVESDTSFYPEELSSAANSGTVFILCLLLSIMRCLSSATGVTFDAWALFLSTYASISNYLCNKYCISCLKIFIFLAI